MDPYDHKIIEPKWQERWEQTKLYATKDAVSGKKNFYTLVEFPYPSGDLHVGHWSAFAVPDIFARLKRMQGYNVLYPIGFDAFGLPAENAAMKHGADPAKWTRTNIEHMRTQLKKMGNMFDFGREVIACDPAFYKWTQWLFLELFKKGLAYRKKGQVNWCPKDQTVLANEQVIDGKCERCETPVEKKELEQWYLKITDYADRLIDDLDPLEWPEPIKEAQRNWIGRSHGAELEFAITGSDKKIKVFTTRPDTLYGATYLVLAPEHPLVAKLPTLNRDEVTAYQTKAAGKSDRERQENKEKTGIELIGIKAANPATQEEIPVFISDYVLVGYGTGAIMAVPAHDERDFAFAKQFGLPIQEVILGGNIKTGAFTGTGNLVNSAEFNGLSSEDAGPKITKHVGGKMVKTFRQRDWLISRQRYWGTPIPIVYDPSGAPHAVPDEHLPWELPTDVDFTPTGEAPLARSKELKERTEKLFGTGWTPEVDTMDTFVDSSWYFLRYLDPKNEKEFCSKKLQKAWMPLDRYSGGAEHTTMHLLYSRFFYKALYDLGLVTESEPYTVRMNRGLILAEDGRKMSKRWGNVINPDEQVANVGADCVKMYLAFIGPYNEVTSYPWNTNSLVGVRRFLERVWGLKEKVTDKGNPDTLTMVRHHTIKKVQDDIESMKFNTSVSALMIYSNELQKQESISREDYETLLKLLAPFAPHMTEELWERLGHKNSIHLTSWPTYDASKTISEMVNIAIQVNGKMRGAVSIGRNPSEVDVVAAIEKDEKLKKYIETRPKKIIYIPNKIINFVV